MGERSRGGRRWAGEGAAPLKQPHTPSPEKEKEQGQETSASSAASRYSTFWFSTSGCYTAWASTAATVRVQAESATWQSEQVELERRRVMARHAGRCPPAQQRSMASMAPHCARRASSGGRGQTVAAMEPPHPPLRHRGAQCI